MNQNAELLNFIYQNSQMGVDSLNELLPIVKDETFEKQLTAQLREYEEIHSKAKELLTQNAMDEKGLSAFEKIRTYLMINIQTMADNSSSHIAQMLIQGSTMGIVDAIKNIRKYEGAAEPKIVNLMRRLLEFEENNVESLKAFL